MEVTTRFELVNEGFADLCLTTMIVVSPSFSELLRVSRMHLLHSTSTRLPTGISPPLGDIIIAHTPLSLQHSRILGRALFLGCSHFFLSIFKQTNNFAYNIVMLIQIVFISIRSIFFYDTVTLSGCQDCSISKVIHLNLVLVKLLELHHLGYDLRHYHAQHHAFIKQFNLPAHFQFDVATG